MKLVPRKHQTDMQFYGMKRSGNHPIISWILGHYQEFMHYNDCTINKDGIFYEGGIYKTQEKNPIKKLISFEDDLANNSSNIRALGKMLPVANTRILLIRDPFNMYASRIKNFEKPKWQHIKHYDNLETWKEVAREFLGETNYLNATIKINYNTWFKDIDYRKELSKHFGEFTDKNINVVSTIGGGSSFDKRKFDGNAQEMKVFERWQEMKDMHLFKKVLQDKELRYMSEKIFGKIV